MKKKKKIQKQKSFSNLGSLVQNKKSEASKPAAQIQKLQSITTALL